MAANEQSVIHLLVNPETGNQFLRVYCRNSLYLSAAQYQVEINYDSIADFLAFPSYYFNYVVLRDERTVDLNLLSDYRIVINATNSTLVRKVFNDPISF